MSIYPKPNLTFGIPTKFNTVDFPQSKDCDCSDDYRQSIYYNTDSSGIIYYTTNAAPVWMKVNITLEPGTWRISYSGTVYLNGSNVSSFFLSTADSTQSDAVIKSNRLITGTSSLRSSGGSYTLYPLSMNVIINVSITTTYYLYGTINTTPSANTILYSANISGIVDDPDALVILNASRI